MGGLRSCLRSKIGRAFILPAILVLLSAFPPIVNPGLAAPDSGGPDPGRPIILSWTEDALTTQTISCRGPMRLITTQRFCNRRVAIKGPKWIIAVGIPGRIENEAQDRGVSPSGTDVADDV